MKIVILAAGIGSRLGNPFPKPLTPLKNGKSIMQMMIENITAYFSIDDLLTVVGFKKNSIMERFLKQHMYTTRILILLTLLKAYYVRLKNAVINLYCGLMEM